MNRLQLLYDKEINFELSCFWDGGIDWALGDDANGWRAEGSSRTAEGAIDALWEAAKVHFPGAFNLNTQHA